MTLDEAIVHAKEVAENWKSQLVNCVSEEGRYKCQECANDHEQLAEWLAELKELRRTVSLLKFNIHALNELIKESETEKEVKVIKEEHSCVSCKFGNRYSDSEPCCNCTDDNDMYEPYESEDK